MSCHWTTPQQNPVQGPAL